MGSTLDPVIERAPCNVVILKNFSDRVFRRVLVPVAGGPTTPVVADGILYCGTRLGQYPVRTLPPNLMLPGRPVPPGRAKKPIASEGKPAPKLQPPGLFAVRLAGP